MRPCSGSDEEEECACEISDEGKDECALESNNEGEEEHDTSDSDVS